MLIIEKKSSRGNLFICWISLAIIFSGILGVVSISAQTSFGSGMGKDYIAFNRVRILDEMAFDRPVEAMSLLVPEGWSTEGSVRWKSPAECRGEIVTFPISLASPDGTFKYMVLPDRSFSYSQDQMTNQTLIASSQQGGCGVSAPFNATQYLELLAQKGLGAKVSNIRKDQSLQPYLDKISEINNSTSQQNGTGITSTGTGVYGSLSWPDGSRGIARVGVMVMEAGSRNMFGGGANGFAATLVFQQIVMRYPAAREAEALKIFATINSSYRANPIWTKAKESYLTQLGNVEHAGRMERLRLQGEQARAYAKSQSAANERMREWERSPTSTSDDNQKRFIQTIREVENWKDGEGNPVELGAGYSHGWSKPDGSIILTNNSLYNPAVELQQNWVRMEKDPR